MKDLQAFIEEYAERVAIKIENGFLESVAKSQARSETLKRAKETGVDVKTLSKNLREV